MENQNFRYVMMFRHRGTEQFHLPRTLGHCETSARACRYLRFAVNAAKNQQFMDMLNCFDVCCACLRALYPLNRTTLKRDREKPQRRYFANVI